VDNELSSNQASYCAPREHLEGKTRHRASVVVPGAVGK
jgi:hypothetical protein